MNDLISRQDAIDALGDEPEVWTDKDEYAQGLNNQWHYDRNAILGCPSAEPDVPGTNVGDCISRQAVIDLFPNDALEWDTNGGYIAPHLARRMIEELPSAQPYERMLHESCTDCPLYDQNRHSCPRFNKVIPETLREVQPEQRWIPCSERPPEEVGLYLVTLDYKEYGKCVTSLWYHGKQVGWDLRVADVVTAWMPLPVPYKGDKDADSD